MILCICKNISESKFRTEIKSKSLEKFIRETGATTQCGSCKETLKQILLQEAHNKLVQESEKEVDILEI